MSNKNWGGVRKGAGRIPLEQSERKKGVNIYITEKVKEDISLYGIGNSFSEKATELIKSELEKRKFNDRNI